MRATQSESLEVPDPASRRTVVGTLAAPGQPMLARLTEIANRTVRHAAAPRASARKLPTHIADRLFNSLQLTMFRFVCRCARRCNERAASAAAHRNDKPPLALRAFWLQTIRRSRAPQCRPCHGACDGH